MYGIEIDRQSELPLWRQIYQTLRDLITSGQLKEEEVLLSSRELARNIGVSRNTVSEAYDMLITEGFLISRQGAPTRISKGVYMEKALSSISSHHNKTIPVLTADFHTGRPDPRQFPRFLWQQLASKILADMPLYEFGYTGPQGHWQLRAEIASWLFRSRGLTADPQDIFITAGATNALHLLADLLYEKRRGIIVEDPCHSGMMRTLLHKECTILPVPVDEQGLKIDYLNNIKEACAIYVTPSHQFPLGGILPASRRTSLIQFAREHNSYIIEDDYDSEFRYCGDPVAPLITMDSQRVIYVGTFSKILFPALRIGYVILPEHLHKRFDELRTYTDVQNPPFEQAVLAELLRTRKLDRHIQKMRRIYGERRQVLLDSLTKNFDREWHAYGDATGLHIALEFPGMLFDETFRKNCLQNGIYITPMEYHCIQKGFHQNKLLLGYGHLEPDEIRNGVKQLSEFIKTELLL